MLVDFGEALVLFVVVIAPWLPILALAVLLIVAIFRRRGPSRSARAVVPGLGTVSVSEAIRNASQEITKGYNT